MTETQQRFLRAIAERVPKDQVVEVHLFPAIRQGGVETGMAIVAERPRVDDVVVESNGHVAASPDESTIDVEAVGDVAAPQPIEADATPGEATETDDGAPETPPSVPRLTVHTARYRLTLKGVDRGKWEVDVVAEADAPLAAVDAVVRGVQRRGGEGPEPDRLTAEAFLDALDAPLATLER
jgi:hypothetical protein